VKWKTYGIEDNTWEPRENLYNCDKVLQHWEEKKARLAARKKKKRTRSESLESEPRKSTRPDSEESTSATARVSQRHLHSFHIHMSRFNTLFPRFESAISRVQFWRQDHMSWFLSFDRRVTLTPRPDLIFRTRLAPAAQALLHEKAKQMTNTL